MNNASELSDPGDSAGHFERLLAAISAAKLPATELAIEALAELRRGVMTGEGPAARGRVHFSRTLDRQDAALCARIVAAAGGKDGSPVSRAEAEMLFDIHDAAREREDEARFDDLFNKAIAHHLLAAGGRPVPPRQVALAQSTPLGSWATPEDLVTLEREMAVWLATRLDRRLRMIAALEPLAAMLASTSTAAETGSIAEVVDRAA
jgi:hypothetical protein